MNNFAWHFIRRDENGIDRLRDGSEAPPDGVWLEFNGPLKMCESGLHFSRHPFDALINAPGEILCRVEIGGSVIEGDDKGVCSRRRIIKRLDVTEGLCYFARMQALSALHKYPGEPHDAVLEWLMTGDKSIRSAAESAVESAARATRAWAAWEAATLAAWEAAAWVAESAAARAEWLALCEEAFND